MICEACAAALRKQTEGDVYRTRAALLPEYQTEAGIPPAYQHARLTDFEGLGDCVTFQRGYRLFGPPRTGKTHFLCALGTALILNGHKVKFATAPVLLDTLRRAAWRNQEPGEEMSLADWCGLPFLLIDDLGTSRETEFAAEILFTLVNHRFNHRLPLSVSSNVEPKSMDSRLLGRLLEMTTEVKL